MTSRTIACAAAIALAAPMTACQRPPEETITFAGSSTILPLIEGLQDFYSQHKIKIRVQGGGTSVGIRSVRDKMALIAMASRELTEEEKRDLEFVTIARDAVAIIVHASNPLNEADNGLIRDIYTGKRLKWDDGRAITVINKEAGRATLVVFEEYFGVAGAIRKDAVIIGANGQAVAAVAGDPQAIAYVSVADSLAAVRNGTPIKVLKLGGVEPSVATVAAGQYKLSRPLNLAFLRDSRAKVEPVLRLLRDPIARSKMQARDFVPTLD